MASSGQPAKLSRPLDFLVISDHSDNMGFFPDLLAGKPELLAHPKGREWYDMIQSGKGLEAALDIIGNFSQGTFPKELMYTPGTRFYRGAWEQTIAAAEKFNEPGRFTAFIGYEWTSLDKGNNLHRNVIFRDNADRAGQVEPFTCYPPLGSTNPIELWKWMEAYEKKTGGSVLAIAHNGNLSNGTMFPMVEAFGKPVDRAYAQERIKWERLYENTQMKGDGEAHPFLSPNDEFANYELWDKANLDASEAKTKEMLEFEYSRSALKNGLALEAKLGVNPYKFGVVGSHRRPHLPRRARGGQLLRQDHARRAERAPHDRRLHGQQEDRREDHGLGGRRLRLRRGLGRGEHARLDLGRDAAPRDLRHDRLAHGRALLRRLGLRAGRRQQPDAGEGRLHQGRADGRRPQSNAPKGKAPTFLVAALKDPFSGNLDRAQIIKGWLDKSGKVQERIYDVAVSGGRKIDADGRCKTPVGSTVDVANATWTNTIGQGEFITVWKDPDFDPSLKAFYYVRVIEIPTPRWTAYDAKYYGLKPGPEVRMTTTERAYTSPIWYTPAN